ncbi:unspecified product [Leishmania tarentolae]|uniref:Unspecified product n=1 Tax=Leishmania tarentolae TaxID=5689 RepID=A0A640KLC4_LEITA|nr:unspecified product [Leishmania tarentolae]GET90539.1 unspecified product [Leishmania tarentolae]
MASRPTDRSGHASCVLFSSFLVPFSTRAAPSTPHGDARSLSSLGHVVRVQRPAQGLARAIRCDPGACWRGSGSESYARGWALRDSAHPRLPHDSPHPPLSLQAAASHSMARWLSRSGAWRAPWWVAGRARRASGIPACFCTRATRR